MQPNKLTPPPIAWSDALSVGITELDAAHRELIELVNDLLESERPGKLEQAIERLLSFTLAHFAQEEAFLLEQNAPARGKHQAEHIRLYAELEAICRRLLKDDGRGLDSATAAFLRHWMVSHIMSHDKRDSTFISKAS
jgi:hemerythrin